MMLYESFAHATKLVLIVLLFPLLFSCSSGEGENVEINNTIITGTTPNDPPSGSVEPQSEFVICWHGRSDYEFLIAYPVELVEAGLGLTRLFTTRPWDNQNDDLANDSLKMCAIGDQWYGVPDPNPWFPKVSFLQLSGNTFVLCENSFPCGGETWNMEAGLSAPSVVTNISNLSPSGDAPLIIGYERTDILF